MADSVTAELVGRVRPKRADVPGRVVERAVRPLLDGIGVGLVGAAVPRSTIAAKAALEPEPSARSVGAGGSSSLTAPALLNGTFTRGSELDGCHPLSPLLSRSLLIPPPLASGSAATGAAVPTAAIVGCEAGSGWRCTAPRCCRGAGTPGRCSGPCRPRWSSASWRGFTPARLLDTLGKGATQAGGLTAAQSGTLPKRMRHGFAARNDCCPAAPAGHGSTGITDVLDVPYGGCLAVFGAGHDRDPAQVTAPPGQPWHLRHILIKSYVAQGGLHRPIEATPRRCCAQARSVATDPAVHPDRGPDRHRLGGRAARRSGPGAAVRPGSAGFRRGVGTDGAGQRPARPAYRHGPAPERFATEPRIGRRDGTDLPRRTRVADVQPRDRGEVPPLTDGCVEPARRDVIEDEVLGLDGPNTWRT